MNNIFISLGSTCGIAYQLQQHNLRQNAYPFDWNKIPNLSIINKIITNNFKDYSDFTIIKNNNSNIYSYVDDNDDKNDLDTFDINGCCDTIMAKNIYGVFSYHDFKMDDVNKYENVKNKYNRRIKRFYDILNNNKQIIFIRDEHNIKKINIDDIKYFVEYICNNFNKKFKLIIICHNPGNSNNMDGPVNKFNEDRKSVV